MKFSLKIEMDNAAFDDCCELPRILAELAGIILESPEVGHWAVRDVNGNRVGEAKYTGRRAS